MFFPRIFALEKRIVYSEYLIPGFRGGSTMFLFCFKREESEIDKRNKMDGRYNAKRRREGLM